MKESIQHSIRSTGGSVNTILSTNFDELLV